MTGVYLLFSFQKKYVSTYSWNEEETGSGKEVSFLHNNTIHQLPYTPSLYSIDFYPKKVVYL